MEIPVVAINTVVIGLATGSAVVRFQHIWYHHVQSMVIDTHMPAFISYRIVDATLSTVALAFEREPSDRT